MSKYLKLYLKLFLCMGIPFGILIGLSISTDIGFIEGVVEGIRAGLFFGLFMSIILGSFHFYSLSRMPYGISEETIGVHHVRSLDIQLSPDNAYDLLLGSLNAINRCRIKQEDRAQGEIIAKAGMTWRSFGESITISIKKIEEELVRVNV